jgi:hypothetical protein
VTDSTARYLAFINLLLLLNPVGTITTPVDSFCQTCGVGGLSIRHFIAASLGLVGRNETGVSSAERRSLLKPRVWLGQQTSTE